MPKLRHVDNQATAQEIVKIIEEDGAVIVDNILSKNEVATLQSELHPYIRQTVYSTNEFNGFKTRRVGALLARSPMCRELALNPKVNEACNLLLSPYCDDYQLHFTQAVSISPGEGAQMLHRDRGVWSGYVPREIETQFSSIWSVTDFTKENGATQVVPGSHLWEDGHSLKSSDIAAAEMKAGSALFYSGSVLHGGGTNSTSTERLGVLLHYTLNWLRQEENQYLTCPPNIAQDFPQELLNMIGYSMGGDFLGFCSAPVGPGEGPDVTTPSSFVKEWYKNNSQVYQSARMRK